MTPPRREPLTLLSAIGALLLCTLCMTGGLALTWLGSQALVNAARLSMAGAVTQATVTDWRVMQSRSDTSFEIRYAFSVPGDPSTYTAQDETGRTNLWESLADVRTWEQARDSRRVDVAYLPDDPHVNRPVLGTGASFGGDQAAGLCLGLGVLLPSMLVFFGVLWGQYRRVSG